MISATQVFEKTAENSLYDKIKPQAFNSSKTSFSEEIVENYFVFEKTNF